MIENDESTPASYFQTCDSDPGIAVSTEAMTKNEPEKRRHVYSLTTVPGICDSRVSTGSEKPGRFSISPTIVAIVFDDPETQCGDSSTADVFVRYPRVGLS